MFRRQRRVVEAELRQRAGTKVLDDDVASGNESVEDRTSFRRLEVERDAFLVAVDAEKVRALFADKRRAPGSRVVAAAGLLDFQNARAHVAEQRRAVRAGQDACQVQN